MLAILALAVAASALLVWVGRSPDRLKSPARLAKAAAAAGAAAVAVVLALRGAWLISLAFVAFAAWLGGGTRGVPGVGASAMSEAQARATLGVGKDASRTEIEAAWRERMRAAHPDHGGPEGLAARLDAARDRLRR